ncbi:hypothetical protein Tco_0262101 [Tanacetum coccineum]
MRRNQGIANDLGLKGNDPSNNKLLTNFTSASHLNTLHPRNNNLRQANDHENFLRPVLSFNELPYAQISNGGKAKAVKEESGCGAKIIKGASSSKPSSLFPCASSSSLNVPGYTLPLDAKIECKTDFPALATNSGGSAEAREKAYCPTLAPNVEDYSQSVARMTAFGAVLKLKMKLIHNTDISPATLRRIKRSSQMSQHLPRRTYKEIKNHWHYYLKNKVDKQTDLSLESSEAYGCGKLPKICKSNVRISRNCVAEEDLSELC